MRQKINAISREFIDFNNQINLIKPNGHFKVQKAPLIIKKRRKKRKQLNLNGIKKRTKFFALTNFFNLNRKPTFN